MSSFDFGSGRHTTLWTYFWVYIAVLYLPLAVLGIFSFHNSDHLGLPWQGFSTKWYEVALHSSGLLDALRTSLVVATLTAVISTVIGAAAGIAIVRFRFPGRGLLAALGLAPLAVPYLGLAVALLLTFVTLGIKPSLATVVIGHSVIAIPYVLLLVATRAAALSESIEEAATDLGATWLHVILRVQLPAVRPALIVGAVTAFQVSFDELYLSYFLTGFQPTLPVYFFSSLRNGELVPPALALTTAVSVVLVSILVITWVVVGRHLTKGLKTVPRKVSS
ncbi:ABC transporter permease [Cryobacterium tagatosivorans]|uniref:ABC transporter permease n=1 Tax=Cryobacterium tagatosivorans TaxID=1259199 RepID=A0A4R8UJ47_9MICO|nr:ABC transporter permease [Cryobacterium tagatosivorans]TFB55159.1 ABC transporter permease [Cryobacterium tagatosivorans]